jgi:hypothetical protein
MPNGHTRTRVHDTLRTGASVDVGDARAELAGRGRSVPDASLHTLVSQGRHARGLRGKKRTVEPIGFTDACARVEHARMRCTDITGTCIKRLVRAVLTRIGGHCLIHAADR